MLPCDHTYINTLKQENKEKKSKKKRKRRWISVIDWVHHSSFINYCFITFLEKKADHLGGLSNFFKNFLYL